MTNLDHLPDYGLESLTSLLFEDYQRTGDVWYLDEAERVDAALRARRENVA